VIFWQSPTKEDAAKYLQKWYSWANESEIKPMQEVAKLIRRHEDNILTYFGYADLKWYR
jgi:transposase